MHLIREELGLVCIGVNSHQCLVQEHFSAELDAVGLPAELLYSSPLAADGTNNL